MNARYFWNLPERRQTAKATDIQVGVTYVNRGAGRTQRKVLAIGDEHRPDQWYGTWGSIAPKEQGVLFEQKGEQRKLYLSSFAAWAKGPVDGQS